MSKLFIEGMARLDSFQMLNKHPGSITGITGRLHRDRSTMKRDLDQLTAAGILTIEEQQLPGHGHMKQVKPGAQLR